MLNKLRVLGHSLKSDGYSDGREIPHLLQNPKVHERVHNSPPLDPILSQFNPAHMLRLHFSQNHLRLDLPSDFFFKVF
jgi:hypothetical protein